ncbi:MAG: hypothetical protein RJA53_1025 [Bacteroidota bacterium]|jgi:hypothetical protein
MGGTKKVNTFPSQALPCSGSTGIFSACGKPQAPRGIVDTKLIVKIIAANCNFMEALTFYEKILMMFKKQSVAVAILLLILSSACAQNPKKMVFDGAAEDRNLSGFTTINLSSAFDVYISQGNQDAVAVSASDESATKRIKTYVSGGVLYIAFDAKGWSWASWKNNKLKAYVTVKHLEKLAVSGACNVSFVDAITSDRLFVSISGASDIKGPVKVNSLKVGASGASNISLSGTAKETDFNISGACSIKSLDLVTDNCAVVASGASSIRLTINQSLKSNISGASDIRYKGAVSRFDTKSSGASSIKPL